MNLKQTDYNRILRLFEAALDNNSICFHQLRHLDSGEIVCNGAVILDDSRVINLFSASSKKKEFKAAASTYIYLLLKKYHQDKEVFDFEGSNIPSINSFFASFGAQTTYYYSLNQVHPLLKLINKAKMYLRT